MSKLTDISVTRNLGISYPIIQGPFGRGGSTALLAASVSNLGGLGSFGANELAPEDILKTAVEIRKLLSYLAESRYIFPQLSCAASTSLPTTPMRASTRSRTTISLVTMPAGC